jgi:hypothetical protein
MNKSIATMKNVLMPTALVLFSLSGGAVFAQQNLIANGSFEVDGATGVQKFLDWNWLGPASDNSDYGVVESTASPDVAEQGNYYAYFHGHPTDGSQDCLGQTVLLTVGSQYTISYYLATDGTTLGSGAAMWVVIGTSFGIDLSQDVMLTAFMPNSPNALPYQKFSTNYTATDYSEILSFHGVDATSSILLDDVSVTLAMPQLNLSLSQSNTLVFNWTSWTNGFRVQANASLGTTNWVTMTNEPLTVASNSQIVLPAPATALFYRLTMQ